MKVLYAIQATGNGHISRANEIIPLLEKKCELDVLVSGTEAALDTGFLVKYRRRGLSFVFGKKGGIDFLATLQKLNSKKFLDEIKSFPVQQYDLVINDFEPISAWAARMQEVPCVALSHQFAVLQKNAPRPAHFDPMAWLVLRHFAPCKTGVGFHFRAYDNHIHTPVIRKSIREAYVRNLGHYTVYLPAYSEKKLVKVFSRFEKVQWHIFSQHCKSSYGEGNCWIRPVNAFDFTGSFVSCEGIITGGGFETPAEALFMGKKLLSVPMKQQYEQQCNAAALASLGVPVIKSLKKKHHDKIAAWLDKTGAVKIDYPDQTEAILDKILLEHQPRRIRAGFARSAETMLNYTSL
ncbi:MAG: glycosyltransferase family protein [Ferruginibacter sp.]